MARITIQRGLLIVCSALALAGCPKQQGVRSEDSTKPAKVVGDPKGFCLQHCAAMSDRERFDFFAKHIWGRHVADWKGHLDQGDRAQGVTLQLDSTGRDWEAAAQDAGLFAKVSPGKWDLKIVVTPRETVKQLADLASQSFQQTQGPGEAVISGLLKAGNPRIEITKQ